MSKFLANVNESPTTAESPIGDLEWVVVSGQGKLNKLSKEYQYVATVVLDPEVAKPFTDQIDEFFRTHRVKKFAKKEPQSLGYSKHKVDSGKVDPDTDQKIYEETGKIAINFKTKTAYADGNPKKIVIFNASGKEVDLGKRQIGNGSRGRLKGVARYYETEKEHGVSLYLNAVQLSKFVAYVGGVQMDAIPDAEEGGFEGFDNEDIGTGGEEQVQDTAEAAPTKAGKDKPRL